MTMAFTHASYAVASSSLKRQTSAGVASAMLYYRYRRSDGKSTGGWRSLGMSPTGGDNYAATINPAAGGGSGEAYADLGGTDGFVDYYVNATDGVGNSGNSGSDVVNIYYCPG